MKLARNWRVFTRNTTDTGAAFRIITDVEETLRLLDTMDAQQAKRDRLLGRPALNAIDTAFYRNLVARGIDDGYVLMSVLTSGEEIVAAALGIRQGAYYAILRISIGGERWSNCSPGRLILDGTIAALHKEGVRQFDLGMGNNELKRRFGAVGVELTDVTVALTLRGVLLVRAAKCVSGYPRLKRLLRRVTLRQADA
jgi:CelD/BcsL family acetyltransferase involved in cellulose biosynthesis